MQVTVCTGPRVVLLSFNTSNALQTGKSLNVALYNVALYNARFKSQQEVVPINTEAGITQNSGSGVAG